MSEIMNEDNTSLEAFTKRDDIDRIATELDYDVEGREGLLPSNIKSLPERIQRSIEERTPEAKQAEEERLKEAGSFGPKFISDVKKENVVTLPDLDIKSEQEKEDDELNEQTTLSAKGVVQTIMSPLRATVGGVAPATPEDLGKMTPEEVREYKSSVKLDEDGGALSLLAAVGTLASFVKEPLSDLTRSLLAYTPVGQQLGGQDLMQPTYAFGRDSLFALQKLFLDREGRLGSNLDNYGKINEEALDAFAASVGEKLTKELRIDLPSEKEIAKTFRNFQRAIAVPYEDKNIVLSSLAVGGAFAPAGGLLALGRGLSLGMSNLGRGMVSAYALGNATKTGAFQALARANKDLPINIPELKGLMAFEGGLKGLSEAAKGTGKVFNLNLARQTTPDALMKYIQGSASFKSKVDKLYAGGMSREKAFQVVTNMKRDFVAAIGGATGYGIIENFDPEADELVKIGFSVLGALTANGVYSTTKKSLSEGLGAAIGIYNMARPQSREKILKEMAEGGKFNAFRKGTFLAMGYTRDDIRRLRRQSYEVGNEELRSIRSLRDSGDIDAANAKLEAAKSKGFLNSKGEINEYYHLGLIMDSKFDRKTMDFANKFWERLESINDVKMKEDFKESMTSVYNYMDSLHSKYPESMSSFVLLLENATQISVLNSLRQSLITQAEFTSKKGGFIDGDLITDIDRYTESIQTNVDALKDVVSDIKGTDKDVPDLITELTETLDKEVVRPYTDISLKRIQDLKSYASSKQNQTSQELYNLGKELQVIAGWKGMDDPDFIVNSGAIQQKLFENLFDQRTAAVNAKFDNLRDKYKDRKINITDALEDITLTQGQVNPSLISVLKEFGGTRLTPRQRVRLRDELASQYFKNKMGPLAIDEATGNIDNDKVLDIITNMLEDTGIYSGTREQKDAILKTIAQDLKVAENNNQKLSAIFNNLINEIPMNAEIDVPSFITLRSILNKDANRYYKTGKLQEFRLVKERIESLDETLESISGGLFKKDYEEARKFYRDNLGVLKDDNSPLNKFRYKAGEEGQVVDPSELFDLFLQTKNRKQGAEIFKNAFYDPKTNEYNQEAIQQLIFAFTRNALSNYNGPNYQSLRTFVGSHLPYFDEIFKNSGNEKFTKTLRDMVNFKTPESLISEEQINSTYNALRSSLKDFTDVFSSHFLASAAQRFTDSDLTSLGKIFKDTGKGLSNEKRLEVLFDNIGRSVDFPAKETFLNTVKNNDDFLSLRPEVRDQFMKIIEEPEFVKGLNDLSQRVGITPTTRTTMEQILEDVQKNAPNKYDEVKNNFKALLLHGFSEAMFPAVQSVSKTAAERTVSEKALLDYLAKENNSNVSDVAFRLTAGRDPELKAQARQFAIANSDVLPEIGQVIKGSSLLRKIDTGRFNSVYKFNLNNELDPIAMQKYYEKNRKLFELLLDEEHLKAVDSLMNLGVLTGSKNLNQSIKNLPSSYTTQMGIGRAYNAMKGVVSIRYLLMEKLIVDYRVAQADIMRMVLADKNTAEVMAGILSQGVFKKKKGRQMIEDIALRLAPYGLKLKINASDDIEEDLEALAAKIRKQF